MVRSRKRTDSYPVTGIIFSRELIVFAFRFPFAAFFTDITLTMNRVISFCVSNSTVSVLDTFVVSVTRL